MKRMLLLGVAAFALAALVLGATTAVAADTACTGPMGAVTIKGNVSAGAGCDLTNTTVNGNVNVKPGGSLFIDLPAITTETTIKGNIHSMGATSIEIQSGAIGGNVAIEGTTGETTIAPETVKGNVEVQKSEAVRLSDATVGGNVKLHHNTGGSDGLGTLSVVSINVSTVGGNVDIHDNSTFASVLSFVAASNSAIGGNLHVNSNEAAGTPGAEVLIGVAANTVGKNLKCENNSPLPTDTLGGPNTAKHKQGQCAGL